LQSFIRQSQSLTNDNLIQIKPLPYEPRIYVGAESGVKVVTIEATIGYNDNDDDYRHLHTITDNNNNNNNNNNIEYQVLPTDDYQYFKIDKISGQLATNRPIDKQVDQTYYITVKAVIIGDSGVEAKQNIWIIVSSYNRFNPIFSSNDYMNCIHNLSPIGTKLLEVMATDADIETYNSRILYTIKPSQQQQLVMPFFIDPDTGVIITNDTLFDRHVFSYEFDIVATDTGSPQGSDTTRARITFYNRIAAPTILSIDFRNFQTRICWQLTDLQQIDGYIIAYKSVVKDLVSGSGGHHHQQPMPSSSPLSTSTVNVTANQSTTKSAKQCYNFSIAQIQPTINYAFTVSAWVGQEVGPRSDVHYFKPKYSQPQGIANCTCSHQSGSGPCVCSHGILGVYLDDNCPLNCQNGGTCIIRTDGRPWCLCRHAYYGKLCGYTKVCPSTSTPTVRKGIFEWPETRANQTRRIRCPYDHLWDSRLRLANTNRMASRPCILHHNGTTEWGTVDDHDCPQQQQMIPTPNAQLMTTSYSIIDLQDIDKVRSLINNQNNNNNTGYNYNNNNNFNEQDRLIEMVDNFNNNTINYDILNIATNIMDTIPVDQDYEFHRNYKNIAIKTTVVSVRSIATDTANDNLGDNQLPDTTGGIKPIVFEPKFLDNNQFNNNHIKSSIRVPIEALHQASKQMMQSGGGGGGDIRVNFVALKSRDLFINDTTTSPSDRTTISMPVIEANVVNATISQLQTPVTIVIECPHCRPVDYQKAQCVYWDQLARNWSSRGMTTEISHQNKSIICLSTHLTAFSVLFDLTPDDNDMDDPQQQQHALLLSIITIVGCYLSICGLVLTLLTYLLFRCLNRDNSGKILVNLCLSLLLLNVSFLMSSQDYVIQSQKWCLLMAFSIHLLVLTSLAWMCVEAIHIYQLLIYVFATAEKHFMLKRTAIAWGVPLLWVMITAFIRTNAYSNRIDFCMISPKHSSDVYYIAYLMPVSILIIINTSVFVLAIRVLFAPRMATTATAVKSGQSSSSSTITMSQVWGAMTLMALLGVSWIFGALAIGPFKLYFQYIFCITNSLQGFLIFVFRVIRYPEARNAWLQLFTSGTFKKYRGQRQRIYGSNATNRLSASDRKPMETDSSYSTTYHSSAAADQSKTTTATAITKPFLSNSSIEGSDVKHFTTYDSIRGISD
ncbi:adhesion G-protein coupled receptor G4-like, partial [Oppia nitens]|uniref:adhesion G-protein coupled receptor G4-like n=1 Tax=Oppia nitens TaxID=1686743 RepID=UPI0023DBF899